MEHSEKISDEVMSWWQSGSGQAGQGWYLMPAMTGCFLYGVDVELGPHTLIRDEVRSAGGVNVVKMSVIDISVIDASTKSVVSTSSILTEMFFLVKPINFLEPENSLTSLNKK